MNTVLDVPYHYDDIAVCAAIDDCIYYRFEIGMFLLTCVSSTRIVGGYVLLIRKRGSVYSAVA